MRLAGAEVVARRRVPGGDINEAERVELADGRVLFVKSRRDPPRGFYAAEAAGLRWLAKADALPLPAVEAVDDAFLALRWVDSAPRAADFDERLGRGLALLHRAGAPRCGTPGPTFLGPLELPNEPLPWPQFYAQQRLAPLAARAGVREVAAVIERIDGLAGPPEPLARLHGDLWSGNVIAGPDGGPWLVDPAAYGGHREVDLAMLELFGSPGPRFRAAYEEVWPLAHGHEERVPLYQLLPLLVHAILFGGSYGAAAARAARRYA